MTVWAAAAVCAFFIKGLCGFANTLVFGSILSFSVSNAAISPVELLLGYPSNILMAWRERHAIRWRICLPLALAVVMGTLLGAMILKRADARLVKLLFGMTIVVLGLELLAGEFRIKQKKQRAPSRLVGAVIGLCAGVLCGLYGVGALLAIYVNRAVEDMQSFRANLSMIFLVENTVRILTYSTWGLLSLGSALTALKLVPWMLVGLGLGMAGSRVLPERTVKRLTIVLLILSGLVLTARSL